jgi:hypothetical protein
MATPKILNGKVVLQVYMLDNSYKTLLVEPTSTVHVRGCPCAAAWLRGAAASASGAATRCMPPPRRAS